MLAVTKYGPEYPINLLSVITAIYLYIKYSHSSHLHDDRLQLMLSRNIIERWKFVPLYHEAQRIEAAIKTLPTHEIPERISMQVEQPLKHVTTKLFDVRGTVKVAITGFDCKSANRSLAKPQSARLPCPIPCNCLSGRSTRGGACISADCLPKHFSRLDRRSCSLRHRTMSYPTMRWRVPGSVKHRILAAGF